MKSIEEQADYWAEKFLHGWEHFTSKGDHKNDHELLTTGYLAGAEAERKRWDGVRDALTELVRLKDIKVKLHPKTIRPKPIAMLTIWTMFPINRKHGPQLVPHSQN